MHPLSETSHASAAARALKDPENRSIEIGIACTLAFHVLLAVLAPRFPVDLIHGAIATGAASNRGHEFNIELAPDLAAPEPKVDPFRFVETNADAPENEPDKTTNFSNRNQQTAQAEAAKELDPANRPSVEGQTDIQNDTAIVTGDRAAPQEGTFTISTRPSETAAEAAAQAARDEQVPLSGTEKFEGETPENVGSNISESQRPSTNAERYVEGVRGAQGAAATSNNAAEATPRQPAPRPRVSHARPTILTNRIAGTYNIGALGIDARWSEYGDYMNELIAIVDAQWRNLLSARTALPPPGTHAVVKFKLNAEGFTEIVSVEETCGPVGAQISLSAIRDREPYRKWSPQMITVLGNEQTLEFGFYFR